MTTIVFLSFDFGSGPIISILISYHGPSSISNGYSSPAFFICYILFCWYFVHSWMYFLTSLFISDHQQFLLINSSIYCYLRCSISVGSWFSCIICSYILWLFGMQILSFIQMIPSSSYACPSSFSSSLLLFICIFSNNVVFSTIQLL